MSDFSSVPSSAPEPVPAHPPSKRRSPSVIKGILVFLGELLQMVLISAAIIVPIRFFLIQPFYVKGASMEPNFYDHEYLVVDEITYRFRTPERGEIVVFRPPVDPSEFFIKRIIGLPGDTVEITNQQVWIYNTDHPEGIQLEEPYLEGKTTSGHLKVVLADNQYYVLGDNRDASLDSRKFGPITREAFIGRVWIRGLPLAKFGRIGVPTYAP